MVPATLRKVGLTQARARLSALVAHVASGGAPVIIERRGRPLAALVGLSDLERLGPAATATDEPRGALGLVGAWHEVGDDELDAMVAGIYAGRTNATAAARPTRRRA